MVQTLGNHFRDVGVSRASKENVTVLAVDPMFPRECDGVMEPAGELHEQTFVVVFNSFDPQTTRVLCLAGLFPSDEALGPVEGVLTHLKESTSLRF